MKSSRKHTLSFKNCHKGDEKEGSTEKKEIKD